MVQNNKTLVFLSCFLVRYPTIKALDIGVLIFLDQHLGLTIQVADCANAIGVEKSLVGYAFARLRKAGLLDARRQPTAAAGSLLDAALARRPTVPVVAQKAPAGEARDTRRSSRDFPPDQLLTPIKARGFLGMPADRFLEVSSRADFPRPIRNDSDKRMTYFYAVEELRAWASHFFKRNQPRRPRP